MDTIVAFMDFLKRENIYEIATFDELSIMCYPGCLLCCCFSFVLTNMLSKPTDSCLYIGNNPLHTRNPGVLQSLRMERFQLIFLSSSFNMVSPPVSN